MGQWHQGLGIVLHLALQSPACPLAEETRARHLNAPVVGQARGEVSSVVVRAPPNTAVTTMHGRHPACFALLVLGGCLTFPTPVAAQQFPTYPDPPPQTNFGQPGGMTDWFWRRDMRQPTPRPIVRPEIDKAASVTAEPVKPQPRLRKPVRNPARDKLAQSERLKSAASWKRMKGDATVRNLRNCLVAYAAREADRDKEASLSTLLIRATEES